MKFVLLKDEYGKTFTRLDLEGLKLTHLEMPKFAMLLDFHHDTYKWLTAKDSETSWQKVVAPVHMFFDKKCQDSDKIEIAETLAAMQLSIFNVFREDANGKPILVDGYTLQNLENNLSILLSNLDSRINLFPRLQEFVEEGNIPMQSFVGVGERAQDTPEMTWYRNDVIPLMAIVLLCKLVSPIFGVFMSRFKSKRQKQDAETNMDSTYKEMHCVSILKDILEKRCSATVDKLELFLHRSIKRMLNPDEDLTHVYNGYTDITIFQQIYAHMLVRRLVLVDLFRPEGNNNLLTYITVCAKSATGTQFSPSNLKVAAQVFNYPKDKMANSSDDGNLSNLEVESRSSNKTADYPLIVEVAADQAIDQLISTYQLDRRVYNSASNYYITGEHAELTPYNCYMLGIVFGAGLCGARSVEMLPPTHVAKMTALMQQYLIIQGYFNLALALTAKSTGVLKTAISGQDMAIRNTWNYNEAFKNCASRFQISVGGIDWSTGLHDSIEKFICEEHVINLAPALWKLANMEPCNGQPYYVDLKLSSDTCNFILQQLYI